MNHANKPDTICAQIICQVRDKWKLTFTKPVLDKPTKNNRR